MNSKDLKLFTYFYIAEHDNLSKKYRVQLMEFVKSASNVEIVNLLKTGKPVREVNITEGAEVLNEFVITAIITALGTISIGVLLNQTGYRAGIRDGMSGTALAAMAAIVSYKIYQSFLSKAARSCKGQKGIAKKQCMIQYKKQGKQKQIEGLKKMLTDCSRTDNPNKCREKINSKITKVKSKLGQE